MPTNEKARMDNLVEITDFFSGGDRKREEILAQPEKCSCKPCMVDDCGGAQCSIKLSASQWVALDDSQQADTDAGV